MRGLERLRRARKKKEGAAPPPGFDDLSEQSRRPVGAPNEDEALSTAVEAPTMDDTLAETGQHPMVEALELVDEYIEELKSGSPKRFLDRIMSIAPEHLAQEDIQEAIRARLARVLDGSLDIGIPLLAFETSDDEEEDDEDVLSAVQEEGEDAANADASKVKKGRCTVGAAVSAIRDRFGDRERRDRNAERYYLLRMSLWGTAPKSEILGSPELMQDLAITAAKQAAVRQQAARRRAAESEQTNDDAVEVATVDGPVDAALDGEQLDQASITEPIVEVTDATVVQEAVVAADIAEERKVVLFTDDEQAELADIWAPVQEMLAMHDDITAEEWQEYQASVMQSGFHADDEIITTPHQEMITQMLQDQDGEPLSDEEAAARVFSTLVQTAKETETAQAEDGQAAAFLSLEVAELKEAVLGYSDDEEAPIAQASQANELVVEFREADPEVFVNDNIKELVQEAPMMDMVMTRLEPDERREFVQAVIDNHQQLFLQRNFDPTRPWQIKLLSIAEKTMASYGAYQTLKEKLLERTSKVLDGISITADKWELLDEVGREKYTEVLWEGRKVYIEDVSQLAGRFSKTRPSFAINPLTGEWKANLYILDDDAGGLWVEL